MTTPATEDVLAKLARQERFSRLTTSRDRSRIRPRKVVEEKPQVKQRRKSKDTSGNKKDTPGNLRRAPVAKRASNPPSKPQVQVRVEKLPAVVQRPTAHVHRRYQPVTDDVPLWDSDDELLASMIEQLLASFRHERVRRELMDFPTEVKMLLDPTIPHSAWCRP